MPPKKGLTVKEYNTKLLEIFDELQREIEYPIGRTRYKKKIQKHSLEENAEYNKLHPRLRQGCPGRNEAAIRTPKI